MPIRARIRGVHALLYSLMGLSPQSDDDGASDAVDSIDLVIVGLGLLLVLLVLLRR